MTFSAAERKFNGQDNHHALKITTLFLPLKSPIIAEPKQRRFITKTRYLSSAVVMLVLNLVILSPSAMTQSTYFVTNTADDGPGSLRAGLYDTCATILFNIPKTDAGYDSVNDVWVIKPSLPYSVPAAKTIDGRLARSDGGFRPGIEIDGTLLGQVGYTGFRLNKGVTLRGLIIHSCAYGIWIAESDVTVTDCYIGTDASGSLAKPNKLDGILFVNGAQNGYVERNLISGNSNIGIRIAGSTTGAITVIHNRIGTHVSGDAALPNSSGVMIHAKAKGNFIIGNLISGNSYNGINLEDDSTSSNTIRGNKIGTNAAGDAALGNRQAGIVIRNGSKYTLIEDNLISGNGYHGIHLKDAGSNFNVIRNNRIGLNEDGSAVIPNGSMGIALINGPCYNTIGPKNIIAGNGKNGIFIDGNGNLTSTIGNTITQNSIYANGQGGIMNDRGGNGEIAPPMLTSVSATQITGMAGPGQIVEVFADETGQGKIFLGSILSDAAGNFTLAIAGLPNLPNITATATDASGNTSAFSVPIVTRVELSKVQNGVPRAFILRQNYPNPFNPNTVIEYELPQSAAIELVVYTLFGQKIRTLEKGFQSAGRHRAVWDGCDEAGFPLASGIYIYRLKANALTAEKKMLRLR